MLLVDVAKEIHSLKSDNIDFYNIPIIINDYEYSWYTYDFVKLDNPDGQAENFLKILKEIMW